MKTSCTLVAMFITLGLFFYYPATRAQDVASQELQAEPIEFLGFDKNLDSMLQLWHVQEALDHGMLLEELDNDQYVVTEYPDSVYIERLANIMSVFDLTYNRFVRGYIHVYTIKQREKLRVMLGLADYYFPLFEEILEYHGVPQEMKYLAIIESALNPRAVSRVGATGLWQFMYGTGRMYGLTINSFVDERRDPIAATHAAARFLKDLYSIYNDWTLVIAAYNCGPGNVNKAIRRAGGKRNYWDIYYYLPRETRGYVPAYIGATYAFHYHKEHNIVPVKADFPLAVDTVIINTNLHLAQVSEIMGVPIERLRDLNPQYRRDIIPGKERPWSLSLPVEYTGRFIEQQQEIVAYKDSIYFSRENMLATPVSVSGNRGYVPDPPSANMTKIYYPVRQGDNLGSIASWYNVKVSDLRYWNNIRKNMIRVGQKLVVYVPKDRSEHYQKISAMSFAEKQALIGKPVTSNKPVVNSTSTDRSSTSEGDYLTYTVKSGDTLWGIAQQFPGISYADLTKLNNLNANSKIHPGQTLRIRRM